MVGCFKNVLFKNQTATDIQTYMSYLMLRLFEDWLLEVKKGFLKGFKVHKISIEVTISDFMF